MLKEHDCSNFINVTHSDVTLDILNLFIFLMIHSRLFLLFPNSKYHITEYILNIIHHLESEARVRSVRIPVA